MSSRVPVISSVPLLLLLGFLFGCGGSSSINVVQPSSSKCDIAVSNSLSRVPANGGNGNLTVETNRECSWSARSEAPWISLSGSEGQGPATVSYTVTPNANGTPRQSAVVVGEHRVAVMQDAAPCQFQVSASERRDGVRWGPDLGERDRARRLPMDRPKRHVLDCQRVGGLR